MTIIDNIRAQVACGVRQHRRQQANMGYGGDPASDLETIQVAFQILTAVLGADYFEVSMTEEQLVEFNRSFIVECGLSTEFAKSVIREDCPNGIY